VDKTRILHAARIAYRAIGDTGLNVEENASRNHEIFKFPEENAVDRWFTQKDS
jgi:hypothetical protein